MAAAQAKFAFAPVPLDIWKSRCAVRSGRRLTAVWGDGEHPSTGYQQAPQPGFIELRKLCGFSTVTNSDMSRETRLLGQNL